MLTITEARGQNHNSNTCCNSDLSEAARFMVSLCHELRSGMNTVDTHPD